MKVVNYRALPPPPPPQPPMLYDITGLTAAQFLFFRALVGGQCSRDTCLRIGLPGRTAEGLYDILSAVDVVK